MQSIKCLLCQLLTKHSHSMKKCQDNRVYTECLDCGFISDGITISNPISIEQE